MSALSDFVCTSTWALSRQVHEQLVALVLRHCEGARASQDEIDAITAARDTRKERDLPVGYENRDGVGVIPISGVIARHAHQVNGVSQPRGTSVEQIRGSLRAALEDPAAHSILLAIDSPGGSVDGLIDMADELRTARERKPVVAHVAGTAASAAYWLGAQANRIYATRGSQVGSIGVVSTVVDDHRRLEQAGVDVRYVTSVEGKVGAGAPGKAVTHRDLNAVKAEVDAWHARFVDAVAAGRGVSREQAAAWGDARMHMAGDAESLGLIDGVADEAAVMESLRSAASGGVAGAAHKRGKEMSAQTEGACVAVAPTVPTSAQDLRGAYPEAVAQIERDAVSAERQRVATIAAACEGEAQPVMAAALQAIADGSAPDVALRQMLRAKPASVAAPASATAQSASPTIEQLRAAAAANTAVGPAPAPEKRTEQDWIAQWNQMSAGQRAEFQSERSLFLALKHQEGKVI